MQLNRDRRAVGSRSWENISSSILQYLGFLHHHVPDQGRVFSLSLLLDASMVAAFINFQLEKGLELNTMLGLLSHLRRGLDYLAVESDLQQGRRVQQVADWMGRLGRQLGHTMCSDLACLWNCVRAGTGLAMPTRSRQRAATPHW